MASRKIGENNDDSTDTGIVSAQISDGKVKGYRGPKHKFKKILKLSPPTSPSSTPEPVRRTSGSNISITEDDKTEQDLTEQAKWADPILRSPEYISSTPRNSTQTKMSTSPSPPLHVHVTDEYRPVTQRGQDYNLVSL